MKQAIWKVAPLGDFVFRGTRSMQMPLFLETPDFDPLKAALQTQYRNAGWVPIEKVAEFVMSDATDYHSLQLKGNVLRPMEESGEIQVKDGTRKRRNTYPPGTVLRFL